MCGSPSKRVGQFGSKCDVSSLDVCVCVWMQQDFVDEY